MVLAVFAGQIAELGPAPVAKLLGARVARAANDAA
jgi:hypothetical protein